MQMEKCDKGIYCWYNYHHLAVLLYVVIRLSMFSSVLSFIFLLPPRLSAAYDTQPLHLLLDLFETS